MEVRESGGVVEIWLRRGEREDPAVQARLRAIYAQHAGGQVVAVFLSGQEELTAHTSALLCGHFRSGVLAGKT